LLEIAPRIPTTFRTAPGHNLFPAQVFNIGREIVGYLYNLRNGGTKPSPSRGPRPARSAGLLDQGRGFSPGWPPGRRPVD
jgi:hypothetical protein